MFATSFRVVGVLWLYIDVSRVSMRFNVKLYRYEHILTDILIYFDMFEKYDTSLYIYIYIYTHIYIYIYMYTYE